MNKNNTEFPYEDIVNLKHHQSKTRPHMSNYQRAAQFAPFAALTGYGDAVDETARITADRIDLSEEEKSILSEKLTLLRDSVGQKPKVLFTYFVADERKSGGSFESKKGILKKFDEFERIITLEDSMQIPIDDIIELSGELFADFE
ncbi:MAG: hypothetical protein EOM34_15595 [Clostridia bacterium]|nr:hypothetical protein [Clostridia bacterium]NCD03872.1 hypothetical protein [Clostridia bacterium]